MPDPKIAIHIDKIERAGSFAIARRDEDDGGDRLHLITREGVVYTFGTDAFERRISRITKVPRNSALMRTLLPELEVVVMESATEVTEEHFIASRPNTHGGRKIYVDLGAGLILRLPDWEIIPNGSEGMVFLPERKFEPITAAQLRVHIASANATFPVFRSVVLDNLPPPDAGFTQGEQRALVWALFVTVFIKSIASSVPLGLFLGPYQCGKTLVQRQLAKVFYGRKGDVTGGNSMSRAVKDLVATVVYSAFSLRDDLSILPPGVADVLNRIATGGRIDVAAFFKTLEQESHQPRATVIISAFKPNWADRPDLLSRFLIVWYASPVGSPSLTEEQRAEAAVGARHAIWLETLVALATLCEPIPMVPTVTRFTQWEVAVRFLAKNAGFESDLDSGLRKMFATRIRVATESDPMLSILASFAAYPGVADYWYTAANLVDAIVRFTGVSPTKNEFNAASQTVRNPIAMGIFLKKLEQQGSSVIEVRHRNGPDNTALWNIRPRRVADA